MREARACVLRLGGIPRDEHLREALPRAARAVSVEVSADGPGRDRLLSELVLLQSSTSFPRGAARCSCRWRSSITTSRRAQLPADKHLHELYPAGTEQQFLGVPAATGASGAGPTFSSAATGCSRRSARLPWKPFRQRALERGRGVDDRAHGRGERRARRDFPRDAEFDHRAEGACAIRPIIRCTSRRKRDFEGLFVDDPEDFRIQPCLSPVWDTAINLIALARKRAAARRTRRCRARPRWLGSKEVRHSAATGSTRIRTPRRAAGRSSSTTSITLIRTTP